MHEIRVQRRSERQRRPSAVDRRSFAREKARPRRRRAWGGAVRALKGTVALGAVIALSSLALQATDGARFSDSLAGSLWGSGGPVSPCLEGMEPVDMGGERVCVDIFPASPSEECPVSSPGHGGETADNLDNESCSVVSREDALPWRYIARHEAEVMCARAGKRLLTPSEWYAAALGTPRYGGDGDPACVLEGAGPDIGARADECRSSSGVAHMAGNVWEWVSGDVVDGEWNGRLLPDDGYVSEVDSAGIALATRDDPLRSFSGDHFWSQSEGTRGILRGGYWESARRGGIYAVNATVSPSFSGRAVGFRCARRL